MRIVVGSCVALGWLATASADLEMRRELTPAERVVIDRFERIVGGVLDRFQGDDWTETVEFQIEQPTTPVKAVAPLQSEFLQRSYALREGSERWNADIAPKIAAMNAATSVDEVTRISKTMPRTAVHVNAQFNVNSSDLCPGVAGSLDLHLQGVAASYRVADVLGRHEPGVLLLFGRWQVTRRLGEFPCGFIFVHPPGSAVIENVVIVIGGAENRVAELLHSVDWRGVNAALDR